MDNNVENIKLTIEERLKELANIQPKNDALKYLAKCEEAYKAYYMVKGVEIRHPHMSDEINSAFNDALKQIEKILEEDF